MHACMHGMYVSLQDWARVEAGVMYAMGSWCLDRNNRNYGARQDVVRRLNQHCSSQHDDHTSAVHVT